MWNWYCYAAFGLAMSILEAERKIWSRNREETLSKSLGFNEWIANIKELNIIAWKGNKWCKNWR